MTEYQDASAHDSGDCGAECHDPNHFYDGDEWTDEQLIELHRRSVAVSRISWEDALQTLDLTERELGPVIL